VVMSVSHHSFGRSSLGMLHVGVHLAFGRWGYEQVMCLNRAQSPFLVNRPLIDNAQVRPEPPVSPGRVPRLEGLDTCGQLLVALPEPKRWSSTHLSHPGRLAPGRRPF
jgi:hypothetical protein